MLPSAVGAAGALAAGGVAWALFESQWVELVERDVPVRGLPAELEGLRILHLSDFHLGMVSFNARAVEQAIDWAAGRELDLVAVTGDLVSRRRGERTLRAVLARLEARHGIFAVLGNHDVAETRDPFSSTADLTGIERTGARLLEQESCELEIRGRRVQLVGAHPHQRGEPLAPLADPSADLRILLTHFPDAVKALPPEAFHLILAGHLHGGQICVPLPGGKVRLEHVRAPYWEGLFDLSAGMLHVSRGLGTSFVPFRFLARPEATLLTLTGRE
jgi:predicted MPP superfamily phosphohydrolase